MGKVRIFLCPLLQWATGVEQGTASKWCAPLVNWPNQALLPPPAVAPPAAGAPRAADDETRFVAAGGAPDGVGRMPTPPAADASAAPRDLE